jgi:hypothetical protein
MLIALRDCACKRFPLKTHFPRSTPREIHIASRFSGPFVLVFPGVLVYPGSSCCSPRPIPTLQIAHRTRGPKGLSKKAFTRSSVAHKRTRGNQHFLDGSGKILAAYVADNHRLTGRNSRGATVRCKRQHQSITVKTKEIDEIAKFRSSLFF